MDRPDITTLVDWSQNTNLLTLLTWYFGSQVTLKESMRVMKINTERETSTALEIWSGFVAADSHQTGSDPL